MYAVEVDRKAAKQIDRLPPKERERVLVVFRALKHDPRPDGVVKLRGYQRLYRVRVGDYRVLNEIYDDQLLVLVIDVGHRRDVYR